MPQYTVKDKQSGKVITFNWNAPNPPGESDLQEVFSAAQRRGPDASIKIPPGFVGQVDRRVKELLTSGISQGDALTQVGREFNLEQGLPEPSQKVTQLRPKKPPEITPETVSKEHPSLRPQLVEPRTFGEMVESMAQPEEAARTAISTLPLRIPEAFKLLRGLRIARGAKEAEKTSPDPELIKTVPITPEEAENLGRMTKIFPWEV